VQGKNFLSSVDAFFEAIASMMSSLLSFDRQLTDNDESGNASRSTAPRKKITQPTRFIVITLGLLIFGTVLLSTLDLLTFSIDFSKWLRLRGEMWRYRILAAIAVLLMTEVALLLVVVAQDRRRRSIEALLLESEERMAFAAEAADLGLWRWDADSDRFWSTAHLREMFGIPAGAQYSMTAMTEAVHPDDRGLVVSAMRKGIDSGSLFEIEYRLALGDGQTRWVRARARATRSREGKVTRIAGTITNISEQRKMKAEAEQQQRSLAHLARVGVVGELSGALAHELNQPLTAILSNAQAMQRMVKQQPIDIEELQGAIRDIIDDDSRAGDVIRHLRALLKKDEIRLDVLEMNSLVTNALNLTRSDLILRRIATVTQLFSGPLPVKGDVVQLQQLLLNLILNASEAMSSSLEPGGVLMISTDRVAGGLAHLSVSDTGHGISPDAMARLFDAFFSTKSQGLGLGLSICRAIVTRHNGKIWAENNPGEGATFHVYLPLAEETPP
jgi:signal transduction histidine kinase